MFPLEGGEMGDEGTLAEFLHSDKRWTPGLAVSGAAQTDIRKLLTPLPSDFSPIITS